MNLRELLLEAMQRTGKGDTAIVGWGRGMGHKGHMYLASSVITHAKELGGDPYFVVSRTVGKDDPITPEEKLAIYKKVFPQQGHIFQTASDEMPDLTRVLGNLNKQGYRNAVVIVGADQVKAFQYLKQYNGKPDKAGNIAFNFDNLDVISRQETNDPSKGEEGPRATPMRQVLLDPTKSDAEQFAVWRDAMNPEISDDEVRDLMNKAKERMQAMTPAPKKAAAKKKEPVAAEGLKQTLRKVVPGYAKREIDKKMDSGKFGRTEVDKDANFYRYKKIQDKIKEQSVSEDWQKVNKSDKTDGMSKKAVDAYRRENPGSKLKTAVTKKPSELKAGSKDAKRRKSFCARMSGVDGPMKDEKGRPTAKAKALSRWNCEESILEGKGYKIDQDDRDEFTPNEIERIKDSHFPDTLRDNLRAAKKRKAKQDYLDKLRGSDDGGDSRHITPVGHSSDNSYEESAMDYTAKRLADKDDGKVAKLRAAGDKRREQQMKGRDIAKRDNYKKNSWGDLLEVKDSEITQYFKGVMKRK